LFLIREEGCASLLMKMISNKSTRETQKKGFAEDYLRNHYNHPTAQDVYQSARKSGLSLDLTTAYRILEGLVSQKKVVTIKTGGKIHYDWIRNDHYRFVCDDCGKIIDITEDKELFDMIAKQHDFEIVSLQCVILHGLSTVRSFLNGGCMPKAGAPMAI
jgi:Fe2+ or Zn2+ uptake regulation protein